jgi:hypothetical protein
MSYSALTTTEVTTGQPASSSTFSKIKDNFSDHESRIETLEAGSSVDYPPIILTVNGYFGQSITLPGTIYTVTNFNLRITGAYVYIINCGGSGTTEIDIQKGSGGVYASIFNTRPSVDFSAGNLAISTNSVIDGTAGTFSASDVIRLDIISAQSLSENFFVRLDYVRL